MSHYTDKLTNPMNKSAILITGGVAPSPILLKDVQKMYPDAPCFCADGGADYCYRAGVRPTYIVGDMDSVSVHAKNWLSEIKVPAYIFSVEKDFSDTQLAIEAIFAEGYEEIIVLGALGGRMDHEMANMMLLTAYGRQGQSLVFLDDQNALRYVGFGKHFISRCNGYIGIVPFSDEGMTLSIEGLYYPLAHTDVPFGESRLVSNVFKNETEACITIERGDGILVISKDKKECLK